MAHCHDRCALFDLDFWDNNPKLTEDPLLPRMDVWTEMKEGWSRCNQVYSF